MNQVISVITEKNKWKEGKELVVNNEYQKAIRIYQSVLKKEEHAFIYFEIGKCYFLLEKKEKANEFFEKGISILEDEKAIELADYFHVYVTLLVEQGSLDKAYEYSKRSVLIARNEFNLATHATICFSLKWLDKAIPTLAYCELKAPKSKVIQRLITKNRLGIDEFWGVAEPEERKIKVILGDFLDGSRLAPWIVQGAAIQQDLYFSHWGNLLDAFLKADFEFSSIFSKRLCELAFHSSQVSTLFEFFIQYFKQDFTEFLHFLDESKLVFPVDKLKDTCSPQVLKWLHELILFLVESKNFSKAYELASQLIEIAPLSVDGYIAQAEVLNFQKKSDDAINSLVKAGMLNKRKIAYLKWVEPLRKEVNQKISNYWKQHEKPQIIETIVTDICQTYDYTSEEKNQLQTFLTAKNPTTCPVFYHWHKIAEGLVKQFLGFDDAYLLRIYRGAFEQNEQLTIFQFLWNHFDNHSIFSLLVKSNIAIDEVIELFLQITDYQDKSYEELATYFVETHEKQIFAHYLETENKEVWTKLLLKMGENAVKVVKKVLLASSYEYQKYQVSFSYEHSLVNYVEDENFTEQLMSKRIATWISSIVQARKMKNNLGNQIEKYLLKGKKEIDFDDNLKEFAQKFSYQLIFTEQFISEIEYNIESEFYKRMITLTAYFENEFFFLEQTESAEIDSIFLLLDNYQLSVNLFLVYCIQNQEKTYFNELSQEVIQEGLNWLDNKQKVQVIEWLWDKYQEKLIPWLLEEAMNMGTQIRQKIMDLLDGNIYAYQYTEELLSSKKQGVREVGVYVLMSLQKQIFDQLKTHYQCEKSENINLQLENHFDDYQVKAFKETLEQKETRFEKIAHIIKNLRDSKELLL